MAYFCQMWIAVAFIAEVFFRMTNKVKGSDFLSIKWCGVEHKSKENEVEKEVFCLFHF